MPPRNRGQLIPRGDSIGARVTIGGERIWLGTFPTEREAQRVIDDALEAQAAPSQETVAEFAGRWVSDYPRPKSSTNSTNTYRAKGIISATDPFKVRGRLVVFPSLRMSAVSREIARAFAIRHPGLAQAARAMWTDALNDGLVTTNPFTNLRLKQSRGRADIVPLTPEEVHLLADLALSVLSDPRPRFAWFAPQCRAMVLVAGYTGIRPGELFALEWIDVDLKAGELNVRRRVWKDGSIDVPKSGESRLIVLPDPAADALRSLPRAAEGRIFSSMDRRIFTQTSWTYYWHRLRAVFEDKLPKERAAQLREARGQKSLTFYEMRHFCATYLLNLGLSAEDVAYQLGHADAMLVQRLYGHPDDVLTRERIRRALRQNVRELRAVDDEAVGE